MKHFFTALTLLGLSLAALAQQKEYRLVWADEFESASIARNWNRETTENPANNELQYYTSATSNVSVVDGNLVLTARRESKGNKSFTSGRVNSNGRVSFTHGMVMARIKLPKTKGGLWPAFWMMGNDISTHGWPYCGELDIVEWGHSDGRGREETYFSAAVHWGADWQQHAYYSYATDNAYSVQDDYHIWKCLWTEDVMRCYLDNQAEPYFEAHIGPGYGPHPYVHKRSHILLNLAIGGDFPGIWDPAGITALPTQGSEAKMLIDWVRVYQPDDATDITFGRNDMEKVPEEERTILVDLTGTTPGTAITPAPTPAYEQRNVRSLFSEHYTARGNGSFFDTWGSPGETIRTIEAANGDLVEEVKNFGWVGFNYRSDYGAVSMTGMDYMHCDIYPTASMHIGITPISQGPQEYDEIYYYIEGGRWNSIDVRLADFKAANPDIDLSKAFQTKWFGGNNRATIYIDNIFYFRGEPSAVASATVGERAQHMYDLQGRKIGGADLPSGIYIKGGKKIVVH